jgi:tetratricopeptide (TPR) repeat protein
LVYPIEKTGMTPVLELCTWYGHCNNLIVQKISKDHVQLMDSHGGKLYLTDPVTPKGKNRTITIDQANKLLNENRTEGEYAKCIAAGRDWEDGFCQSGRLVGITGPTVCHTIKVEGGGYTNRCEADSVPGSGWIPVKYINHTAPNPGCTRLTDHPNYESCVGNNETNTNAMTTGSQRNQLLGENREAGNATDIDNKAAKQALEGNHHSALSLYQKALRIDPYYTYALTGVAIELYHFRNYTGAIKYYDKALAIDPQYISALNNKGLALYNLGNYTEAILYYDKALIIQPNDTYALDHKAAALDNLGNHTGSILYYNKALAMDPKSSFALTSDSSHVRKQ